MDATFANALSAALGALGTAVAGVAAGYFSLRKQREVTKRQAVSAAEDRAQLMQQQLWEEQRKAQQDFREELKGQVDRMAGQIEHLTAALMQCQKDHGAANVLIAEQRQELARQDHEMTRLIRKVRELSRNSGFGGLDDITGDAPDRRTRG